MELHILKTFKLSDINVICKHLSKMIGISVYYVDNKNSIKYASVLKGKENHYIKEGFLSGLFDDSSLFKYPIIKFKSTGEFFFAINLFLKGKNIGKFIVGPFLYPQIFSQLFYFQNSKMKLADESNIIEKIGLDKITSTCILCYHLIYNKWLDEETIIKKNNEYKKLIDTVKLNIQNYKLQENISDFYYNASIYEKKLFFAVIQGDKKAVAKLLKNHQYINTNKVYSNDVIKNAKINGIYMATIVSKISVVGHLNYITAFCIRDFYIDKIESTNELSKINNLIIDMVYDFVKEISEMNNPKYTYTISKCKEFIDNHIYEKLTSSDISRHFGLNASYFSKQFKHEIGMSPTKYILSMKVEEAKKIIKNSDKSILDIALLLNFHDQSHFTKTFKKYTGYSPKDFRNLSVNSSNGICGDL